MDVVVLFDVEAGTDLQVGRVLRVGQVHLVVRPDVGTFLPRGANQVDPQRVAAYQVLAALHRRLPQAAIDQFVDTDARALEHRLLPLGDRLAQVIGQLPEHVIGPVRRDAFPQQPRVLGAQFLEQRGQLRRRAGMDEVLQLRIVLLEQQRLGDFPLGHLLVMQQPDHAALALQDVFEFLVGHGLAGNLGLLGFEPRTQGLWVPGTGTYSSPRGRTHSTVVIPQVHHASAFSASLALRAARTRGLAHGQCPVARRRRTLRNRPQGHQVPPRGRRLALAFAGHKDAGRLGPLQVHPAGRQRVAGPWRRPAQLPGEFP